MTEEPHRSRRTAIMKAHPEVSRLNSPIPCWLLISNNLLQVVKLMGHEPWTKYIVSFVVFLQIFMALYLRNRSPLSPLFIFCSYAIGGTANQNLFLAIHEITHNLAFKGVWPNKLFAMFANLPIGIPYCVAFKVHTHLSGDNFS